MRRILITACLCLASAAALLSPGCRRGSSTPNVDLKAFGEFELDPYNGTLADVPARFRKLDGQRVAMDGFMWAPASANPDVTEFQLVYRFTNPGLPRPPLVQERVFCHVASGKSVPYYEAVVHVTGILHVRIDHKDGKISSLYSMDVDSVVPCTGSSK